MTSQQTLYTEVEGGEAGYLALYERAIELHAASDRV